MAQAWDIVVIGGAYMDYRVQGPHLPVPGETVVGDEGMIMPGGKGANQAVAAVRLGAEHVAMVARVSTDRQGDEIVTSFQEENVDTRFLVRDSQQPSGISLIQVEKSGEKQMMFSRGASQHLTQADVTAAEEALRQAKVLLIQLEIPMRPLLAAARIAHEAGAAIIFDPAPPLDTPAELLPLVTIIKPDSVEAQKLTGQQVEKRETARQAAQMLLRRGVQVVAIQAGDEGDLLVWREREVWLPRLPVKSIDATGAGDTFAAALAVALVEDRPLEEAGHFASAAAALATTKAGARSSLPRRSEVEQLLARLAAKR
jgi:ribokinase